MQTIIDYVNKVFETQKDPYHGTPLFADAVNIHNGKLFRWVNEDGSSYVVSDLSTQQNFMRLLVGLTALTGDEKYKEAAVHATKYVLENYTAEDHLIYWGGHSFIDLETREVAGPNNKEMVHELKNCFPYYDLMFEVDAEKTSQFIEAFWNAHIYNWEELEVGRHGIHTDKAEAYPFNHEFVEKEPHRTSTGLSFINAGSDLMYAAAKYAEYNKDEKAYKWSEFLAKQYVNARDPETKLGAYQFTQKIQSVDPVRNHIPDKDTNSMYGDRAKRQFGEDYPQALESKMLLNNGPQTIYSANALMQLQLYSEVGKMAQHYKDWSLEAILAFIKYLYQPEDNTIRPMITDGTDLTGYVMKKDGYYGSKGTRLQPYKVTSNYLLAFARAYLIIKDDLAVSNEDKEAIWKTMQSIARGLELGEIGEQDGSGVKANLETENYDGRALLGVVDLYRASGSRELLTLGRVIADNIVKQCYHNGYFTLDKDCIYGELDMVEPLALLALEAAEQGKSHLIPEFINGKGFIEGCYRFPDGTVLNIGTAKIYAVKKGEYGF